MKKEKRREGLITLLVFAAIFLVMNAFVLIYVKVSHTIYFWDSSTYWDIAKSIRQGGIYRGVWQDIYNSISTQDYNFIAAIPSALLMHFFGESRLVFVLGILDLYLMPSLILMYFIIKRTGKQHRTIFAAVTVLLFPLLTYLTIMGFVDIGGLIPAEGCYLLFFARKEDRNIIIRHIFIGLLMVMMIIWRRWYAYYAVSFLTAMFAASILYDHKILPPLITAAVVGLILWFGFHDFVTERLMQDYGSLYSGYKFSVSTDFKLICRYFGLIYLVLLFAASVYAVAVKHEIRPVFAWIQTAVCFAMFVFTQTHGQQHLLLYVPSIVFLTSVTTGSIDKKGVIYTAAGLAVCGTVFVFIPHKQPTAIAQIKYYAPIPDFSLLPQKRADAEAIRDYKKKLDTLVPEGKNLGVLASSFIINESILKNVESSLGEDSARTDYIVSLPQVDSRDRNMSAFYDVNYILEASPAQTHLGEGKQTVVERAVGCFEDHSGFAEAYEVAEGSQTEISGVKLTLYKRIKPVSDAQKKEFEKK